MNTSAQVKNSFVAGQKTKHMMKIISIWLTDCLVQQLECSYHRYDNKIMASSENEY